MHGAGTAVYLVSEFISVAKEQMLCIKTCG